jgi:hypothetical protein
MEDKTITIYIKATFLKNDMGGIANFFNELNDNMDDSVLLAVEDSEFNKLDLKQFNKADEHD